MNKLVLSIRCFWPIRNVWIVLQTRAQYMNRCTVNQTQPHFKQADVLIERTPGTSGQLSERLHEHG